MKLRIECILKLWTLCIWISQGHAQCTFGSAFSSTTWVDNTKSTLTFTTQELSGWTFNSIRSIGTYSVSSGWQCVDHVEDSYLVLRTKNTFFFEVLGSTKSVYAYLCMKLTKITSSSYYYYQQSIQELNLGGERLKVSESSSLTRTDVCDSDVSVPASEYHVIIKSGEEQNAAITCPNSMLFTADYNIIDTDGTTYCADTTDTWNVCSNKAQMEFDTSTCTKQAMFSSGGKLWCVANINSNGYDYTTVYNQDATITSDTRRFSCISSNGGYSSVAPNNCTAYQTPTALPLEADQSTATGHRLVVTNYIETCDNSTTETTSSGLSGGAKAAIVISVLIFVFMCAVATFIFVLIVSLLVYICMNLNDLTIQLNVGNSRQLTYSDMHEPEKEKTRPLPDIIIQPTSPSNVFLKSSNMKDLEHVHNGVTKKQSTITKGQNGHVPHTKNVS